MRGAAQERRDLWQGKPVLRAVYEDFHRRLAAQCIPGRTLEVGAGIGSLKAALPDLVTTDIAAAPWLDIAADGQALPFVASSFANLVAVDVVHHVEFPRRFFSEAIRVVRPGGRIVLLEPAVTAGSYLFYRFLHDEGLDLGVDPLVDGIPRASRDPKDANQAVPTLLFGRHHVAFADAFPELALREFRHLSLLAYPLSGGFRPWSLVPRGLARALLRVERQVEPVLGPILGFRLLAVLDRL